MEFNQTQARRLRAYWKGGGDADRKHSGIVEYVDANGILHRIEGNNEGRPVDQYVYPDFINNYSSNLPENTNGIILGIGLRESK